MSKLHEQNVVALFAQPGWIPDRRFVDYTYEPETSEHLKSDINQQAREAFETLAELLRNRSVYAAPIQAD